MQVRNTQGIFCLPLTYDNLHSVSSDAVAQMFNQYCFPVGRRFTETFDIAYQSGGVWYDNDVWWRVFTSEDNDVYYSRIYIEITVINRSYAHASPSVTKYVVSPQYQTSPNPAVIQLYKSNASCHGIRVGRDSSNHWYVDLLLRTNTYDILAQGINFKRSSKLSKVTMDGFSFVSSIVN